MPIEPVTTPNSKRFCEVCGTSLMSDGKDGLRCPKENYPYVHANRPNSYVVAPCRFCDQPNQVDSTYCAYCGGKLVEDRFIPLIAYAWRAEPQRQDAVVKASGTITGLTNTSAYISSFVDALPTAYPGRAALDSQVAELQDHLQRVLYQLNQKELEKEKLREELQVSNAIKESTDAGFDLITAMGQINLLFKAITKDDAAEIFKTDFIELKRLMEPCPTAEDLSFKIGAIHASLETDLTSFKALVKKEIGGKTITHLQEWIKSSNSTEKVDLAGLRNIPYLRGGTAPFHQEDARVVEICKLYDEHYPPNYPRLWLKMRGKLRSTLTELIAFLNGQIKS